MKTRTELCPDCLGNERSPFKLDQPWPCKRCKSSGEVEVPVPDEPSPPVYTNAETAYGRLCP